jgi:hypothetical protein
VLLPEVPEFDDSVPDRAESSTGAQTEATVRGELLPRQPGGNSAAPTPRTGGGNTTGPSGGAGGGGARVETDVRGEILSRTPANEMPGDATQAGTISHPFTHTYFFAKGVGDGVNDAAKATGGTLGQIMVASYYLMTGRPQDAQIWLGLKPGESLTLRELQEDLKGWGDVVYGDPKRENVVHSYESGRFIGKQLAEKIAAKYGERFRAEFDIEAIPELPKLPAPGSGQAGGSDSAQTQSSR